MGIQMELPDRKVNIKEKGWRYIWSSRTAATKQFWLLVQINQWGLILHFVRSVSRFGSDLWGQ